MHGCRPHPTASSMGTRMVWLKAERGEERMESWPAARLRRGECSPPQNLTIYSFAVRTERKERRIHERLPAENHAQRASHHLAAGGGPPGHHVPHFALRDSICHGMARCPSPRVLE